jgi:ankyrin repeat protein
MDVVIELLKHGADIHATNKEGETALTLAQEEGRVEIERLLEIPNSARQIAWQNRETERKGEPKLRIRSESEIARIAQKKLAEQSEIAPRKIRRPIIKGDSDIARNARKGLARRKIPFNRDEFVNMARQGDISTMKLFLAAGINPNVEDNLFHRETALMVAAGKGHTEIVKLLLEMGANPDIQNDFNGTALLNAAKEGHTESLRLILEADLEIDAKDIHGATALMHATQRGDTEMVRLILQKNPDVNLREDGRWGSFSPALKMAAEGGHVDIVKLLLEHGADTSDQAVLGTALWGAARSCEPNILQLMLDNGAVVNTGRYAKSPLLQATGCSDVEIVKTLLENGADVNRRDEDDRTDFMAAVKHNRIEFIGILFESGADINAKDYDGETALMYAALDGNTEMVEFLVENGADVNAEDNSGATALSRALLKDHAEIVELLEQAGAIGKDSETSEDVEARLLEPAAEVHFFPSAADWDDDSKADGAEIELLLRGKRSKWLDFEGIELSVEIRIYASTEDVNRDEIDGRLIYDGTHTLSSRKDRIKIPYDDMKDLEPGEDYWAIDALVTLPDGRTIEQKTIWGSMISPDRLMKKMPTQ